MSVRPRHVPVHLCSSVAHPVPETRYVLAHSQIVDEEKVHAHKTLHHVSDFHVMACLSAIFVVPTWSKQHRPGAMLYYRANW